jgi:hypothetical protein
MKKTLAFAATFAALAFTGVAAAGGCPSDRNGDGNTDFADLIFVLNDWGCAGDACAGDVTGDGMTNPGDLIAVLTAWGPCGAAGCTSNADCNDGDACTIDFCINGTCYHFPFPGPGCN